MILLSLFIILFSGCSNPELAEISPITAESFSFSRGVDLILIEGETGPGALYSMSIPAAGWNGDLILYCHGYINPELPVSLPDEEYLRNQFSALGYGFALSSYSDNGWVVMDALIRTQQLIELFTLNFGEPGDILAIGPSMGSMIPIMLAEKNSDIIDGALAISSFLGGTELLFERFLHIRVLFDYYYPDILPGGPFTIPEDVNFDTEVTPLIVGAILANILPAFELAAADQASMVYHSPEELFEAIIYPLHLFFVGGNDLLERTHGHIMVENIDTNYSIGGISAPDVNTGVERFEATPDAQMYLKKWYEPSGDLKVPLMSVNTTRDPAVPIFHQTIYADRAVAEGASDLLFQIAIDRAGHIDSVTDDEIINSTIALDQWIKTGIKPPAGFLP